MVITKSETVYDKEIEKQDIDECVEVIKKSFSTVANDFNLTAENSPRFTAFATTSQRLEWQLTNEKRSMLAYYSYNKIAGYYSLAGRRQMQA